MNLTTNTDPDLQPKSQSDFDPDCHPKLRLDSDLNPILPPSGLNLTLTFTFFPAQTWICPKPDPHSKMSLNSNPLFPSFLTSPYTAWY